MFCPHGADMTPLCFAPDKQENSQEDGQAQNPGFRNFLCEPGKSLALEDQFNKGGRCSEEQLRTALEFLAGCMKVPAGAENTNESQHWENERIPSGYTYLAQLIGHDLVHSSIPVASSSSSMTPSNANLRHQGLMLETLYGNGPAGHALSYYRPRRLNADGEVTYSGIPNYLRMSSVRDNSDLPRPNTFRDLPRARSLSKDFEDDRTHISVSQRTYNGLPEILIPDSRNDDNAILAQMTALFHLLHNIIMRKIEKNENIIPNHSRTVQDIINFHKAKSIVISIYHKIIREDFLSKILHPEIYTYYRDGNSLLDENKNEFNIIPLEFSYAAYRFGHAMIRPDYVMSNDKDDRKSIISVINHSSGRVSSHFPLRSNWIVSWSNFFSISENRPANLSRKIGPNFTTNLSNLPDKDRDSRLAMRDLLRGCSANSPLWSVSSLIREIRDKSGKEISDLFERSTLLSRPYYRKEAIKRWFGKNSNKQDKETINFLAEDPPLFFFVLFEASHGALNRKRNKGQHLGLLGSVIVGDTLFSYLKKHEPSIKKFLKHENQDFLLDIASMEDLISYIDNNLSLEDKFFPLV